MILFFTAVGVVLVISFMCSIFESVLLSVTRPQVEMLGRSNPGASDLLTRFKENMDVPIAAILILNTAAHTIGAAVAGASYVDAFSAGSLWLFSILFTLAVLLFTEIIPKTLGVSHAIKLAPVVAHGIRWLTVLLKPLVVLSERISRSLRGDAEAQVTSAEEIKLLALLGRSEGIIGSRMAHMIVGATQMRDLRVHDIMLPRDEVRFLSGAMQRDEVLELIRESGLSRFPFTPTNDLDDLSGVVIAKDLLYWLVSHDETTVDWESIRLQPLVVPESSPVPQLLRTFQENRRHLAVVVDEYGSVEGIATLEDVLEEIVGDIEDETDRPSQDIVRLSDGSLLVPGTVDLRKLSTQLEVAWEPEGEAATIGGLVTETLESIPVVGDSIVWNDFWVTVLQADSHRAVYLSVRTVIDSE
jgi:CBS domain containing-hemolysin-like protein